MRACVLVCAWPFLREVARQNVRIAGITQQTNAFETALAESLPGYSALRR